jgi:hypothetical protein
MTVPSDQELLEMYLQAIAAVATGQSYNMNGRSLTRADLAELRTTVEWLESRITAANGDGTGGTALVRFNNPI